MKISLPKCPESAPKCFFSKPIFNQKELLYQLLLLHGALCPWIRLSKSGFTIEQAQSMSQWQPGEIVVLKFWDRGSSKGICSVFSNKSALVVYTAFPDVFQF